jgi:SAM-dependent methyltransferase
VDALDPQPADDVLELASGTAEVSAALVGRVGSILATDVAPGMVEAAKRRGLAGVEHRVLDMQALELPDGAFDKVACRFGYMLVPDRAAAFAETRRVLRPGGRLAFATWAPAQRNPWATPFGPSLVSRGLLEAPEPGQPGQFALGDPETIEAAVRGAGFEDVVIREVDLVFRIPSWQEYVEVQTAMATSLREALESAPAGARGEILEEARARFEPLRTDDGYAAPGVALVTRAV